MKFPFQSKTTLSAYPYNSRIAKSEFSTTQPAKNHILHGFIPGNALQASELNEIQENFYLLQNCFQMVFQRDFSRKF